MPAIDVARTLAGRRVPIGVAAALLCTLAGGCRPKPPVLSLKDIKLSSLGVGKTELLIDVGVFNPNWYSITLKRMGYALHIGGRKLADGATTGDVPVCRGGEWTVVPTSVSIDMEGLYAAAREFGDGEEVAYAVTGRTVFDCLGLELPVKLDKSGTIVRVRRLRWRLKRIRPPRDGKGLRLVFDVSNPNAFDVPIVALSGSIDVGGEALVRIDRPSIAKIPAGAGRVVEIPVHLDVDGVAKVIAAGIKGPDKIKFVPRLKLSPPISLKHLVRRKVKQR